MSCQDHIKAGCILTELSVHIHINAVLVFIEISADLSVTGEGDAGNPDALVAVSADCISCLLYRGLSFESADVRQSGCMFC